MGHKKSQTRRDAMHLLALALNLGDELLLLLSAGGWILDVTLALKFFLDESLEGIQVASCNKPPSHKDIFFLNATHISRCQGIITLLNF